ncbi:hypothetical protein P8C59_005530 [Phyllachora maydis]|uniref:Uncharacterized protein n=1 Tax=Phyllachora maydis TaxID=1825666 RepID=A0AAD9I5K9_9PEZI|nr:hypothetical protein P8C59_005530 [Phyllachora maydis]
MPITELDKNGDTPLAVLLQSLCRHPCLTRRYHRYIKALYGPGVNPGHKNAQSKSVIDHLQDLLRLDHAQARTRFLDKMLQVVDAPTGGKDMRFLPQPHKRVRPGSL